MADDLRVSVRWRGTDALKDALSDLKSRVRDATIEGLQEGGADLAAQARANAVVNPQVRTGRLDASITPGDVVDEGASSYRVTVAPRAVVYARAQELGAYIVAKRARFLRIPVGSVYSIGAGVGSVANLTRLGGAEATAEYIYRRSVTLPPRPYLRPALDEQAEPFLRTMGDKWGRALQG